MLAAGRLVQTRFKPTIRNISAENRFRINATCSDDDYLLNMIPFDLRLICRKLTVKIYIFIQEYIYRHMMESGILNLELESINITKE